MIRKIVCIFSKIWGRTPKSYQSCHLTLWIRPSLKPPPGVCKTNSAPRGLIERLRCIQQFFFNVPHHWHIQNTDHLVVVMQTFFSWLYMCMLGVEFVSFQDVHTQVQQTAGMLHFSGTCWKHTVQLHYRFRQKCFG